MGFKENWQAYKKWDMTYCPTGWNLALGDTLKFAGQWDTTTTPPTLKWVDIHRFRSGGSTPWATGCSFGVSKAGLEQVTGTDFIITRTPADPSKKAQLECVSTALTDSRAGSWTAEEGATMDPILPWEAPSDMRQQA